MGWHFAAVCEVVSGPDTQPVRATASFKRLFGGFPRPSHRGVPAMSAYV